MQSQNQHDTNWPPPNEIFRLLIISFVLLLAIPMTLDQLNIINVASKWQMTIGESIIILPAMFYIYKKRISPQRAFRLRPISSYQIILSLAVAVPLTLLFEEINRITQLFIPMPEDLAHIYHELFTANSGSEWLFLIVNVIIMAGFFEEMVFRGLLQQTLEHNFDITRAIMTTAFIFALMHGNPFAVIQIVFLGIIIGVLAWRNDSVWPAVIIHVTLNFLSLIIVNTDADQLAFLFWHGHLNPLFIFFSGLIVVLIIKEFYRTTE
ncbi:MAG: CPBP family intramembrane metalloprotease [Calditrichaeota bacterium]|nr:MAG: CPBP family intramembrane metalloprotease [Calditrichota bacterium]